MIVNYKHSLFVFFFKFECFLAAKIDFVLKQMMIENIEGINS